MKVIITGSRNGVSFDDVLEAIRLSKFKLKLLISGTGRGVDRFGESYAIANSIPIKRYSANWEKYGKKARYLRNEEMFKEADALIAVWDGESKGTKHMIDLAIKRNLKCFIYNKKLIKE